MMRILLCSMGAQFVGSETGGEPSRSELRCPAGRSVRYPRACRLISAVGVALFAATLSLVPGTPAMANIDSYRVSGTGRAGLTVRANPKDAKAASRGRLTDRTPVSIVCAVRGRKVRGNTVWHQISGPIAGWVSDSYINAPGTNKFIAGERDCGTAQAAGYRNTTVAAWAMAHAQDAQPYTAMCAWFASLAVWQGGIPKNSKWTSNASYKAGKITRSGTVTANLVVGLRSQLLTQKFATETSLGDTTVGAVPAARVGDLIMYDWNGDKTLDHVSVIVNIAPGQVPEVAEWGSSLWPSNRSTYVKRAWNWSENAHMSEQQNTKGKVRAVLLHVTY